MDEQPTRTEYECVHCHAKDSDSGNNTPAPVALNCWNCHAKGSMVPTVNGQLPFETPAEAR